MLKWGAHSADVPPCISPGVQLPHVTHAGPEVQGSPGSQSACPEVVPPNSTIRPGLSIHILCALSTAVLVWVLWRGTVGRGIFLSYRKGSEIVFLLVPVDNYSLYIWHNLVKQLVCYNNHLIVKLKGVIPAVSLKLWEKSSTNIYPWDLCSLT